MNRALSKPYVAPLAAPAESIPVEWQALSQIDLRPCFLQRISLSMCIDALCCCAVVIRKQFPFPTSARGCS